MQMMASKNLEYDGSALSRIQYLYSAVVRSLGASANPKDPTRRVMNWRRLVVWTDYNPKSGTTNVVILRCPGETQERLLHAIMRQGGGSGSGPEMLRDPMLVHALLAEDLIVRAANFSQQFASPIYELENNLGHSAAEYTQRARRFMTMARQMGNVLIDYDVYLSSLNLLQEVSRLIRDAGPPAGTSRESWDEIHRNNNEGRTFEHVYADFELRKRYGQLYEQRAAIGNNEVCLIQHLLVVGQNRAVD